MRNFSKSLHNLPCNVREKAAKAKFFFFVVVVISIVLLCYYFVVVLFGSCWEKKAKKEKHKNVNYIVKVDNRPTKTTDAG